MRLAESKSYRLLMLFGTAVFVLMSLLLSTENVFAHARPYLKVQGADIFAGGGFENNFSCDSASAGYQTGNGAGSPEEKKKGGILTFAINSRGGTPVTPTGSSSNYAAFALGTIDGLGEYPAPGDIGPAYNLSAHGFGTQSFSARPPTRLTFSNNVSNSGATNWGGLFEGANRGVHCIPDYFAEKKTVASPTSKPALSQADFNSNGQKYFSGSATITTTGPSSAITISRSINSTVFIDGNLYIERNIVYADSPDTISTVPKLAVVVRGDIYINPSVYRLDGFYIAQPAAADPNNTGRIWTCHYNTATAPTAAEIGLGTACDSRLVINGALSAKQVMFMRTRGSALLTSDALNAAEVLNFTPEMIMGGSFFDDGSNTANTNLDLQSLISLPPIF